MLSPLYTLPKYNISIIIVVSKYVEAAPQAIDFFLNRNLKVSHSNATFQSLNPDLRQEKGRPSVPVYAFTLAALLPITL